MHSTLTGRSGIKFYQTTRSENSICYFQRYILHCSPVCLIACPPARTTCIYICVQTVWCVRVHVSTPFDNLRCRTLRAKKKRKSTENVFQPSKAKDGKRVFRRFHFFSSSFIFGIAIVFSREPCTEWLNVLHWLGARHLECVMCILYSEMTSKARVSLQRVRVRVCMCVLFVDENRREKIKNTNNNDNRSSNSSSSSMKIHRYLMVIRLLLLLLLQRLVLLPLVVVVITLSRQFLCVSKCSRLFHGSCRHHCCCCCCSRANCQLKKYPHIHQYRTLSNFRLALSFVQLILALFIRSPHISVSQLVFTQYTCVRARLRVCVICLWYQLNVMVYFEMK